MYALYNHRIFYFKFTTIPLIDEQMFSYFLFFLCELIQTQMSITCSLIFKSGRLRQTCTKIEAISQPLMEE